MECRDFREVADSYLSDELLVETNHDVIAHLEACAECRRELAARRELRSSLRAAFKNAEELRINDEYANQLRSELRSIAPNKTWPARRRAWMGIAACLIAGAVVGFIAWQRQPRENAERERRNANVAEAQPQPAASRPAEVAPANVLLANMSELAAGDHRDCAINHRLPDRPLNIEEAGRKYDPAYLGLRQAVMSHGSDSGARMELVMAHACVFKGRWFAHIVVRHRGRLASLLVTRLETQGELAPETKAVEQHGQVISCSRVEGFQISCFQTARHAVFLVSDLSEGENLALARQLAPPVHEHITRAEV